MRAMSWLGAVIFLIGMFEVGGCARALEPTGSPNAKIPVLSPPPAPRTETTPAPPGPGHVWVPGHYAWTDSGWTWVRGRWQRAREGYTWVNPRYEESDGRGYYILGGWVEKAEEKNSDGSYSAGAASPDGKASPAM